MIPKIVHTILRLSSGEIVSEAKFARDRQRYPKSTKAADMYGTVRQSDYPEHSVISWTYEKICSAAGLYDQTEIVDGLHYAKSNHEKYELAKLFLIDTIGGFLVDGPGAPIASFLAKYENHDLLSLHAARTQSPFDLSFIGARPRLRFISKSRDRYLSRILADRICQAAGITLHETYSESTCKIKWGVIDSSTLGHYWKRTAGPHQMEDSTNVMAPWPSYIALGQDDLALL